MEKAKTFNAEKTVKIVIEDLMVCYSIFCRTRVYNHCFVAFNDSLRESSFVTTFSLGFGRG